MSQAHLSAVQPQTENDKLISALAYIFWFIVAIVILVTDMKNSRFNKIHAYQSLVFAGAGLVFYIIWSIITGIIGSVFWPLACVLWVGYFLPFALALYFAFKVFTAGQVVFPTLTDFTAQIFKDL
jgi:uncharacterized membrane protein